MKRIVITGGTRGIGLGLAKEFLKQGHKVAICGRSEKSVNNAKEALHPHGTKEHIFGMPCDVSDVEALQAFWDGTVKVFGGVDIWINNAAVSAERMSWWELSPEEVAAVVQTNYLGVFYACQIAMKGMLSQGHGYIYNMEGLGSAGPVVPGLTTYASTKAALTYFTKAMIKEAQDTPVKIGFLNPGIVLTDLYTGEDNKYMDERTKKMSNILADRVEDVTPYLAKQIIANQQHGKNIKWLTGWGIAWRFLKAPFSKRDLFS